MTETPSPSSTPALSTDRDALLTQLVTGPSIREVATNALQPSLNSLYPTLRIDPRLAMVVTPGWTVQDQQVVPGPWYFESLTDILVRLGVGATSVTWLDGEHYLTLQPLAPTPVQLPVDIEAIARLLNELAPLLFVAFAEQQVEYWNQLTRASMPRWKELARSLRELWNVQSHPAWDDDQRAMARGLFDYPQKTTRHVHDHFLSRACLIDLDTDDNGVSRHLNVLDMAVLIGTLGKRTLILTHTITQGFQAFDSLQALGASLHTQIEGSPPGTLQWRLIEPEGDYFDHLACNLIALQADAITALATQTDSISLAPPISRTTHGLNPTDSQSPSRFKQLQQALPEWMAKASSTDLTAYSRHLMELAQVQIQNSGQSFDDGIPPIQEFALKQLREAMLKDHPDAAELNLADIRIVVESVVVWGAFAPPLESERSTFSLGDLALQNLISLPTGNKTVCSLNGSPVPAWMTASYLAALITTVDIGRTYPALIKSKLRDDSLESLRRQNLFTSRLRVELPLLALQQKIRAQAGVDETGYRYIAAVVQIVDANRRVDGQEIVIRPLALNPAWRPGQSTDEVANMYVIGPRQMDKGPCLLYRPLLDHCLSQYPSPANLLYAIKHSPTLRQSVLAWLPGNVRANYANYVFSDDRPTVWSLSQLLADPLTSLQMSGTLALGTQVLNTDYLASVFKANVSAMIELADRQSISNSENRWESFKRAGWLILNAALPFFGRTAGTAAWIWQILDDLQQTLDAGVTGDTEQQKSAMTDLLLTLAMVLAHHANTRNWAHDRTERASATLADTVSRPSTRTPVTIVQQADVLGEHPVQHRSSLHTDAALNLAKTLDRFAVTRPASLVPPASETGLHAYLYRHATRYYAPVGERWFEVTVAATGDVSIINSEQQPGQHGPALIRNRRGEWFVDTRLRLRGGGLSRRRLAKRQENRERIAALKKQLTEFDAQREQARQELTAAYNAMKAASDQTLLTEQTRFLELLERRTGEYAAPIEQLKALNLLETVPNFRSAMTEMLGTQLFFNQTWLDQRNPTFAQALRETLVLLEAQEAAQGAGDVATYRKMSDLSEGMINRIEFAHSRFQELSRLGKSAAQIANTYRTKLPAYSVNDLKALQVSLARDLCLKEQAPAGPSQAQADLVRLIDSSNLVIQTSQELMTEHPSLGTSERIEGLNDLLEQFADIAQSLEDFQVNHKDEILDLPFEHLRTRIGEFQQQTEKHLAQLLLDHAPVKPLPGPSRPAPASRKRVIKTRFKGTVVGELRPSAPGQPILLDVKAPMTGNVIATFHEKTPGVWVERVQPGRRHPTASATDLATQLTQGQTLLEGVEGFIRQTEVHAKKPGRIPIEIEELFQHKAEQLDEQAKNLEQARLRANSTEEPPALIAQLHAACGRLYAEGYRVRVQMIKQQPPTAARIQWLLSKEEVVIVSSGARRRLKGPRKDYLQEYEIRERGTGRPLWYAHFHYDSLDAPVDAFTAAHLKLQEQRRLAGAIDLSSASSNPQIIAIYRSAISPQQARALFFK